MFLLFILFSILLLLLLLPLVLVFSIRHSKLIYNIEWNIFCVQFSIRCDARKSFIFEQKKKNDWVWTGKQRTQKLRMKMSVKNRISFWKTITFCPLFRLFHSVWHCDKMRVEHVCVLFIYFFENFWLKRSPILMNIQCCLLYKDIDTQKLWQEERRECVCVPRSNYHSFVFT